MNDSHEDETDYEMQINDILPEAKHVMERIHETEGDDEEEGDVVMEGIDKTDGHDEEEIDVVTSEASPVLEDFR